MMHTPFGPAVDYHPLDCAGCRRCAPPAPSDQARSHWTVRTALLIAGVAVGLLLVELVALATGGSGVVTQVLGR